MSDSSLAIVWDSALVFKLHESLVDAAVNCLGYGSFLILAIIAFRALLQQKSSSVGRRYIVAAVAIFFVSTTVIWAADLVYQLANLAAGPNYDNQSALRLAERLFVVITVFSRINYILSDCLVIWRAWVLADRRVLRLVLAVSMVITAGCTIADGAYFIHVGLVNLPYLSLLINLLLFIPLVLNNLLATGVVLYKAWTYRKEVHINLRRQSQIGSLLFLLIESGFIYCGWWTLFTIAIATEKEQSVPFMFHISIAGLSPYAAAIYPMLIILVVEHQKFRAEQATVKGLSQSLRFNLSHHQSSSQTDSADHHTLSIIQSIVNIQSTRKWGTTTEEKGEASDQSDSSSSDQAQV